MLKMSCCSDLGRKKERDICIISLLPERGKAQKGTDFWLELLLRMQRAVGVFWSFYMSSVRYHSRTSSSGHEKEGFGINEQVSSSDCMCFG